MTDFEKEAMLRRAFVSHNADYIVVDSRRQQRQIESANYGINRGWLSGQWHDDGQCTAMSYRLTPDGRRHFGIEVPE